MITLYSHTGTKQTLNDTANYLEQLTRNGTVTMEMIKAISGFIESPTILPRLRSAPGSSAKRYHHAYDGGLVQHLNEMLHISFKTARFWGLLIPSGHKRSEMLEIDTEHFIQGDDLLAAVLLHDLNKLGGPLLEDLYYVPNHSEKTGKRSDAQPYKANKELITPERVASFMEKTMIHTPASQDSNDNIQEGRSASAELTYLLEVMSQGHDYIPDGYFSLALVRIIRPDLHDMLSDEAIHAIIHHDGMYGAARRNLQGKETPLQMILHWADMMSSRLCSDMPQETGTILEIEPEAEDNGRSPF